MGSVPVQFLQAIGAIKGTIEHIGDLRMTNLLAGIVRDEVLLRHISNILALRVLREKMVEGLILPRPHVGRNGLIPFFRIAEFGVDIEDHATKRKDPVTNDLTDKEPRALS